MIMILNPTTRANMESKIIKREFEDVVQPWSQK